MDIGIGAGAGSTGCPVRAAALGLGTPVSGFTPQGSRVAPFSDACVLPLGSLALAGSFDGCHAALDTGADEGG